MWIHEVILLVYPSVRTLQDHSRASNHTLVIEWNFASVVYEQMAVTPNAV